ncbi:hypothetical protein HK098_001502 [Nowakowskiella sp. JEL0407]|nr:hypothetical protein HK098_001502 [Nowakowskiella sp. JEL0407]
MSSLIFNLRFLAFGVGTSMSDADIVVSWKNSTNGYTISDRLGTGHQVPSFDATQDTRILYPNQLSVITPLLPKYTWSQLSVTFRRPLRAVNSSEDKPIQTNAAQSFIFALGSYAPMGAIDFVDSAFSAHATNDKGVFIFDFFANYRTPSLESKLDLGTLPVPGTEKSDGKLYDASLAGTISVPPPPPLTNSNGKQTNVSVQSVSSTNNVIVSAHSWLMLVGWGVFGILGSFIAHYGNVIGRSSNILQLVAEGFAVLLTFTSFILIVVVSSSPHFSRSLHAKIGLILVCILTIAIIAKLPPLRIKNASKSVVLRILRFIQKNIFHFVLVLFVIGNGIAIYEYSIGDVKWIIIFSAYVALWFVTFGVLEILGLRKKGEETKELLDDPNEEQNGDGEDEYTPEENSEALLSKA